MAEGEGEVHRQISSLKSHTLSIPSIWERYWERLNSLLVTCERMILSRGAKKQTERKGAQKNLDGEGKGIC